MKKITAYSDDLSGGCGVEVLSMFEFEEFPYKRTRNLWGGYVYVPHYIDKHKPSSGAGWLCASFNQQDESKAAYEALSARYPLLYQTEPRPNKLHGKNHYCFFAMFDTRKTK